VNRYRKVGSWDRRLHQPRHCIVVELDNLVHVNGVKERGRAKMMRTGIFFFRDMFEVRGRPTRKMEREKTSQVA
jgi:hypothetical protein